MRHLSLAVCCLVGQFCRAKAVHFWRAPKLGGREVAQALDDPALVVALRKPLVALPGPLSAPAGLPQSGAAARKSFRPTASRTCGTNTEPPKQNQSQIPCACRTPLEKTVEADISILLETGHFYFALTRVFHEFFTRAGPGEIGGVPAARFCPSDEPRLRRSADASLAS